MIALAIIIACGMLGGALLLNFLRLLRGPLLADRILALDTLYITAIALLLLFDMRWQQTLYFEAALLIAVFGFISTVALAKFRTRGAVIE